MKKKIVSIILISIFSLSLGGCQKKPDDDKPDDGVGDSEEVEVSNEGVAYGIVYDDYIGVVRLNVVDGIISYINFDEAFLPISWAIETKVGVLTDIVKYPNGKSLTYNNEFSYAKYIVIDEEVFTGVPYTDEELTENKSAKQLIKYSSAKIPDLYKYLEDENHAKWYVTALKNGKAFISDQDGKKLDLQDYNPYGSFFKSSSLYWIEGTSGWAKNIQLFSNALVGTSLSNEPTMVDGYINFGNITTSATLQGYMDYYQLAKKAYNKVK